VPDHTLHATIKIKHIKMKAKHNVHINLNWQCLLA